MEHVVFFPTRDGGASFRRLPSFEEAVRLVEHLRNVEGIEQVSVHSMTEVPLNFRAYYRVEVPQAWGSGPQAAPPVSQAQAQPHPAAVGAAREEPDPEAPVQEIAVQQAAVSEVPRPESIALEPVGEPLTLVPAAAQQESDVSDDSPAEGPPSEAVALAPEPDSAPALALVESVPVQAAGPDAELAASNGRSRDSGSSLGFFA